MRRLDVTSNRGMALIAVLLVASLIFVIGVGLALMLTVVQLVARNHREAAALVAAADGAVDLAADALVAADWQAVLAGGAVAPQSDGGPSGVRAVAGSTVDLAAETNRQNCGRPSMCSAADLQALSAERPWGANNPVWQLFLFGPLAGLGEFRFAADIYVLVWVGDDGRETDGRPDVDGGNPAGRHVLRARAMAVGREGGRRVVDAEIVRVCLDGRSTCEPSIRVQSQREVRHAVP
jgi:hypothetical protein